MKEVWKDIKGYEDRYRISNMGHVLSLSKTHKTKVFNKAIVETKTSPKILKGSKDKDGYLMVYLGDGKKQKRFKVHRLVAETFIPKIDGKTFINHKNGIKDDNRADNLEWCTNAENLYHAHHTIRHDKPYYNQKVILCIGDGFTEEYKSITEAAKAIGVSKQAISMCLRGQTKKCCGCKWRYK